MKTIVANGMFCKIINLVSYVKKTIVTNIDKKL